MKRHPIDPPETQEEDVLRALQVIARGRTDNTKPLPAERARQIARRALNTWRLKW